MTGTDPAGGTTGRSAPRLALIAIGTVVLLALAVWAFSAMGGGRDDGRAPAGPTGPSTTPSQQVPTSVSAPPSQRLPTTASTDGATQRGAAAIALTPTFGPDSRNLLVRGSGFGANEEVVLSIDGTEAKRVRTDSSGAFTATLTVPFSKSTFTVRANGATSNRSAKGTATF